MSGDVYTHDEYDLDSPSLDLSPDEDEDEILDEVKPKSKVLKSKDKGPRLIVRNNLQTWIGYYDYPLYDFFEKLKANKFFYTTHKFSLFNRVKRASIRMCFISKHGPYYAVSSFNYNHYLSKNKEITLPLANLDNEVVIEVSLKGFDVTALKLDGRDVPIGHERVYTREKLPIVSLFFRLKDKYYRK